MAGFGWSLKFCRTGISSAKSQVLYNALREQEWNPLTGPKWRRVSDGYVKQEFNRLQSRRKQWQKKAK